MDLKENKLIKQTRYEVSFLGVEIIPGVVGHKVRLELRDPSDRFVIEYGERLFVTSVPDYETIFIYELYYEYVNSNVFSTSRMKFQVPRPLKPNEQLSLYLGSDLTD